ncbi:hypothetical protein B0H10DRAFT_2439855 [Mycena sp. CBHHK59/15]|nr:hypothetical protein B0H10DRAFT_2439855 [Mycena sp. CBHHK59/15]
MSHRSLLFTSNVDLQSMQFLDSCATPQRKEHAYQVAQSDGWWNFASLPPPPSPHVSLPITVAVPLLIRPSIPLSSFASTPSTSRRSSVDTNAKKHCSHCQATSTPLWRRDPATQLPLCNACGLYLQQRNKMRPPALIAADREDDEPDAPLAPDAPECSHCHTRRTSVWRRSKSGAKLCNACGVYARLRGRDRPLSLKRNKIKPRCKHPKVK